MGKQGLVRKQGSKEEREEGSNEGSGKKYRGQTDGGGGGQAYMYHE